MTPSLWRKGFLSTIVMLCIALSAISQEDKKEFFFDINSGVSIPVLQFRNDKFGDGYFASTGSYIDVDAYLGFSNLFTVLYSFDYSYIPFNEDGYSSEYKRVLNINDGVSVEADNYQFINSMFGLGYRTFQFHNFQLFYSLKFGYSVCFHPEISVEADDIGQINFISSDSGGKISFSQEAKLSYFIKENIAINLVYNTVNFKPSLSNENKSDYRIHVQYQNLGLGITYKLDCCHSKQ